MDYQSKNILIEVSSKDYLKRLISIATIAVKNIKKKAEGEK